MCHSQLCSGRFTKAIGESLCHSANTGGMAFLEMDLSWYPRYTGSLGRANERYRLGVNSVMTLKA